MDFKFRCLIIIIYFIIEFLIIIIFIFKILINIHFNLSIILHLLPNNLKFHRRRYHNLFLTPH